MVKKQNAKRMNEKLTSKYIYVCNIYIYFSYKNLKVYVMWLWIVVTSLQRYRKIILSKIYGFRLTNEQINKSYLSDNIVLQI